MLNKQLQLIIVSQERKLIETPTDSVTAPTSDGIVTILPKHIPLMSRLVTGELVYRLGKEEHSVVVSRGFLDVSPENKVTVIVDTAKHIREISLEKAQQAVQDATETMEKTTDQRELLMAEASLKQALLEIKLAEKTRKARI